MASSFIDVCRFNPTLGGTTDWTYSSAVTGYQSPTAAGAVNGAIYSYRAENTALSEWEVGFGAYSSGTGVFSRTTVLFNSAGTTSNINFTSVPQVAIVALAEDLNLAVAAGKSGLGLDNVSFAVSASAGALTISLKDAAGNDATAASPIAINFRSATLSSGPLTQLTITAASSIVIPAAFTFSILANTACRIWITGFNDAGTFRLGVFNASSAAGILPLAENGVATSLIVGSGLGNIGAHYTAGAGVTSKAFRILGYVDWTASGIVTPGTWTTTNLNSIQTFGPGIKRPGDVVQVVRGVTTTTTTNSTTAYVVTNLTATIQPTSAANLVLWSFTGLSTAASGTTTTPLVQMFRAANSTPAVTTALGPVCFQTNQNNSASAAWWLNSATDVDAPNTAVAIAYTVGLKSSAAFSASFPEITNGQRGVMMLQELMG